MDQEPITDFRGWAHRPGVGTRPSRLKRGPAPRQADHRRATERIPGRFLESLLIFEYDLDPDYAHARLVRCSDASGSGLVHRAGGSGEANPEPCQYQDFLGATNDLTYARLDNGSLILGGRSISNGVQKITPDDVARSGGPTIVKSGRDAIDAFKAKWDNATYSTEGGKERRDGTENTTKEKSELRVSIIRRVERPPVASFSLDPTSTIAGLSQTPN